MKILFTLMPFFKFLFSLLSKYEFFIGSFILMKVQMAAVQA